MKEETTDFGICMVCGKEPAPPETGLGENCAKNARPGLVLMTAAGRAMAAALCFLVLGGCVSLPRHRREVAAIDRMSREKCLADLNQIDRDFQVALADKDGRIGQLEKELEAAFEAHRADLKDVQSFLRDFQEELAHLKSAPVLR